jgi:hypothetical protein
MNVHSPAHAGHTAQGAPCPAPEDEAICFRDYFLTKIVFILRYRVAYEEIRREERPGRARAGGSFGAGAQARRDTRPRAPLSHQIENDRWDPRPGHPANVRKALQVIGLPRSEEHTF